MERLPARSETLMAGAPVYSLSGGDTCHSQACIYLGELKTNLDAGGNLRPLVEAGAWAMDTIERSREVIAYRVYQFPNSGRSVKITCFVVADASLRDEVRDVCGDI